MKGKIRRSLSMIMVMILLFTTVDISVLAVDHTDESETIVDELDSIIENEDADTDTGDSFYIGESSRVEIEPVDDVLSYNEDLGNMDEQKEILYENSEWVVKQGENKTVFATYDAETGVVNFKDNSIITYVPKQMFGRDDSLSKSSIKHINFEENSCYYSIEEGTFKGCTSLVSVSMNACNKMTTIGSSAFEGCEKLTSFESAPGLRNISASAFANCGFTEITLASSITSIGLRAFADNVISSVKIKSSNIACGQDIFAGCQIATIDFGDITLIPDNLFYGAGFVEGFELTLPDKITSIGETAFYNTKIKEVIIDPAKSQLIAIKGGAFAGCTTLDSFTFPNALITIGKEAFRRTGLTGIQLASHVESVGEWAFKECKIENLTLPGSISTVGEGAFQDNTSLTKVTFDSGKSVNISKNMFKGCNSLNAVDIAGKIQSVGTEAFSGSLVTELEFNDVDTINDCAFRGMDSLKTLKFGNVNLIKDSTTNPLIEIGEDNVFVEISFSGTVNTIGKNAFKGAKVNNFIFKGNVDTILKEAFKNAIIGNLTFDVGVKTIGENAFDSLNYSGDLKIPNVATIGKNAFVNSRIKGIIIKTGLEKIGDSSFSNCKELVKAELPKSLKEIGASAFNNCVALSTLDLTEYPLITELKDSTFQGCIKFTATKMPKNITKIGNSVYSGCTDIETITIPETVISIGKSAFVNCKRVTSVVIPDKVKEIGDNAFRTSSGDGVQLNSVVINTNVLGKCGTGIFENSLLDSVTLSDKITEIPENLFNKAGFVTNYKFNISNNITKIGKNAFNGATASEYVFASGSNLKEIGEGAFSNNIFAKITLPESLEIIDTNAFAYCIKLTEITIPENVKTIGSSAFEGCSILADVYYNAINLESSNINIFKGCTISKVILGSKVEIVPANLFNGASFKPIDEDAANNADVMIEIIIPKNVTKIGKYSFTGIKNISKVTYEDGSVLEEIGEAAFKGCSNMTENVLPESVSTISKAAFMECTKLDKISIPENVTQIGESAFEGTALKNVVIPAGITGIGVSTFKGCTSLVTIKFAGENIKTIDGNAFDGCTSLKGDSNGYFKIPDGVEVIGTAAFKNCNAIDKIYFPYSVRSIADDALSGWTGTHTYCAVKDSFAYKWLIKNGLANSNSIIPAHKITYVLNDTEKYCASIEGCPASYIEGTTTNLVDPVRKYFIFGGWYIDEDFETQIQNTSEATDDITVYAKWIPEHRYKVDYIIEENVANDPANPVIICIDEVVQLKPLELTGYTFKGWFAVKEDGSLESSPLTTLRDINADIKLKAVFEKNGYTIIYKLNGGTNSIKNPEKIGYYESIVLEDPVRPGFTFNGWYTQSGNREIKVTILENVSTTVTLTAKWTANTYNVTYIITDEGVTTNNPITIRADETVRLDPLFLEGYEFMGWFEVDATGKRTEKIVTVLSEVQADIILEGVLVKNSFDITYILDGGTNNVKNPKYIKTKDTVRLEKPEKKFNDFDKWVLVTVDKDGNEKETAISTLQNVTGNIVLKAIWKPYTYKIKYNTSGATGVSEYSAQIKEATIELDEEYVLACDDSLAKKGSNGQALALVGWNTKADGTGDSFACGAVVSRLSEKKNDVINLFPVWKDDSYYIRYYPNGKNGCINGNFLSKVTASMTSKKQLYTAAEVERPGYELVEWNTKKNGKGARYNLGQKVEGIGRLGKVVKLYAIWKPITYTITYEKDGGTLSPSAKNIYTAAKAYTFKKPKKAGYKFKGWYTNPEFTGKPVKKTTNLYGDITLYAKWQPK